MKKKTFHHLINVIFENDVYHLMTKVYRGGNYPVDPAKILLVFIWFISHQDTLRSIGDRFNIVASTVMKIVNIFLYIIIHLKRKYIIWPKTAEERHTVKDGFKFYPNVLGAIDGTHIKLNVPSTQRGSYTDRNQNQSVNLMTVCTTVNLMAVYTSSKLFTYVFIGYPGSAHDSRVFSNSLLYRNIEENGKHQYFPDEECHIIGDSAFLLRTWLRTPFKRYNVLNRMERYHNYCLSSDRVCIEIAFAFLKARWARLKYIDTNSVSKATEIITAACILHNFCLLNGDIIEERFEELEEEYFHEENDRAQYLLGEAKGLEIAVFLSAARH